MTINKVIFGGETLVDLTNDTVAPDTLAKGVTAHDKTGVQITGTMEFSGHQIFEIFSTLRKDENDIDGAYPCDGREFSKSDFSGGNNPYDMLLLNKAKTLSYAEYDAEIAEKGVCFHFALDETNEKFKIPKLINDTIQTLTGVTDDVGETKVANVGSSLYCGDEDTNHVLQFPSYNLDYPTVEHIQPSHFENISTRGGAGTYNISFPSLKIVSSNGFSNAFLNCKISAYDFSSVTTIEDSGFSGAFKNCEIGAFNFPLVTTIKDYGFSSAFSGATFTETEITFPVLTVANGLLGTFQKSNITKLSFPSLVEISGSMENIAAKSKLSEVEFPNLTTISTGGMRSAFENTLLTVLSFPKLKTISSDRSMETIVLGCQNLTQLQFPVLESLSSLEDAFGKCPLLTSLSFPKLTKITSQNAFRISSSYPSYATNTITELHFGAANQAAIEATSGYPTLWGIGAGKATVYFDL